MRTSRAAAAQEIEFSQQVPRNVSPSTIQMLKLNSEQVHNILRNKQSNDGDHRTSENNYSNDEILSRSDS